MLATYSFGLLRDTSLEWQWAIVKPNLVMSFDGCVLLMIVIKPISKRHMGKRHIFI